MDKPGQTRTSNRTSPDKAGHFAPPGQAGQKSPLTGGAFVRSGVSGLSVCPGLSVRVKESGIPDALFDALAPFRAAKIGVLITSPDRGMTFQASAYRDGQKIATWSGDTQVDALIALHAAIAGELSQ